MLLDPLEEKAIAFVKFSKGINSRCCSFARNLRDYHVLKGNIKPRTEVFSLARVMIMPSNPSLQRATKGFPLRYAADCRTRKSEKSPAVVTFSLSLHLEIETVSAKEACHDYLVR